MPQITSLTLQKKNKNRINIFLEGKFALGVSQKTFAKFNLKKGLNLTLDEIGKIQNNEKEVSYFDKSLNFLSFRSRSEKEIFNYLATKISQKEEISIKEAKESPLIPSTIAKLKKYKFVDDVQFAREWVTSRSRSKPKGKIALRAELIIKGIDKKIIDSTLEITSSDLDLAIKSLKTKIKRFEKLKPQVFKNKVYSYLTQRGFSYDTIKKVFDIYSEKD